MLRQKQLKQYSPKTLTTAIEFCLAYPIKFYKSQYNKQKIIELLLVTVRLLFLEIVIAK
jgi:hypothetical protein